jgi:hypothetical protein
MRDITRRLNTIEKKLSVGKHREPTFPTVILCLTRGRMVNAEDQQKLGPEENWIIYQEQLQPQQEANEEYLKENPCGLPAIIKVELDVEKEYQARSTKSNQKQPKAEKLGQQDEQNREKGKADRPTA